MFSGIPLLVSLLTSSNRALLPHVVSCIMPSGHDITIFQLSIIEKSSEESVEEVRSLGAVPLLLSLLSKKDGDGARSRANSINHVAHLGATVRQSYDVAYIAFVETDSFTAYSYSIRSHIIFSCQ